MNTTKVPSTHSDHDTQPVPCKIIESMEGFEFDSMTDAQVETAFEYLILIFGMDTSSVVAKREARREGRKCRSSLVI